MALRRAISLAAGLASLAGVGYLTFALARVLAHRSRGHQCGGHHPPVTLLKPVCGLEPELYENLRSFCDQEYPEFQVVFGVRDPDDPAIAVIRRVIEAFPSQRSELVVGGRFEAVNFKVANLANMVEKARHDLLIIADSDMRVDRDYLASVVAPFADGEVGATTCLYGGTPVGGLASTLGAMFINDHFSPSVLVALAFQKLRFAFGATIAITRETLKRIGGFEALSAHLADDYMIGKLVSNQGLRVELGPYAVQNIVFEPDFGSLWLHELRWARTIRTARPLGYALSFVTYAVPMSLIFLLASRNVILGGGLLVISLGLRVLLHYAARRAFRVRGHTAPWLIPARDMLSFAVWVASFFGRGVRWREQRLSLQRDGRIAAPVTTKL